MCALAHSRSCEVSPLGVFKFRSARGWAWCGSFVRGRLKATKRNQKRKRAHFHNWIVHLACSTFALNAVYLHLDSTFVWRDTSRLLPANCFRCLLTRFSFSRGSNCMSSPAHLESVFNGGNVCYELRALERSRCSEKVQSISSAQSLWLIVKVHAHARTICIQIEWVDLGAQSRLILTYE